MKHKVGAVVKLDEAAIEPREDIGGRKIGIPFGIGRVMSAGDPPRVMFNLTKIEGTVLPAPFMLSLRPSEAEALEAATPDDVGATTAIVLMAQGYGAEIVQAGVEAARFAAAKLATGSDPGVALDGDALMSAMLVEAQRGPQALIVALSGAPAPTEPAAPPSVIPDSAMRFLGDIVRKAESPSVANLYSAYFATLVAQRASDGFTDPDTTADEIDGFALACARRAHRTLSTLHMEESNGAKTT